ncbi:MAG: hypothetical protein ACRDDW_03065 [Candidatus Rhabdochlamydia sp.]
MKISHDTQTSHYKEDPYDLDIDLKAADLSISPHENMNPSVLCTGRSDCICY